MKERRVLEKFKEFLSPLRLPRVLRLKFEGCDGVSNAWYEDDAITVCYEYMEDILRTLRRKRPRRASPEWMPSSGRHLKCFCTRSDTPCSTISTCLFWDVRKTQRISLLRISSCSLQKAMHGD